MSGETYVLRVDISIEKRDAGGGYTSERLSVREEFDIAVGSFLETAHVLGKFHQLAEQVKK